MFIIVRNGRRTVITGWRAWLMTVVAAVLIAFILVSVVSLVLGIAVTIFSFLIVAIPVVFLLALIMNALQPKD